MYIYIAMIVLSLLSTPIFGADLVVNDKGKYFTIKFNTPLQIKTITIEEEGSNIYLYAVEHYGDYRWHTIHFGDTIGHSRTHNIEPIVVERLRLKVLRAKRLPTIRVIRVE